MPDGRHLIITRDDKKTHELYEVASGKRVREFPEQVAFGRPFVDNTGGVLTSVGLDDEGSIVARQWDVQAAQLQDS